MMNDMDKKGTVLNSAFAVSAAFTFGGHLAFTMAFDPSYVLPLIVGKLISGICALILVIMLYKNYDKKDSLSV
jgi:ethanolamine transporter